MAIALEMEETVSKGIQRILTADVEAISESLTATQGSREEHYHEARKHLKKVRAILRLVRESLGEKTYRRENETYGDLAKLLGEVRDAQVLPATFAKLLDHYRGQVAGNAFARAGKRLQAHRRKTLQRLHAHPQELRRALAVLGAASARLPTLTLDQEGWKALRHGLSRVYENCRDGYRLAYRSPTDLHFHEWRKSVKYLRHQIDVLAGCWPKPLGTMSDRLHELSDCLGYDHDLAMLRRVLAEKDLPDEDDQTSRDFRGLRGLTRRRQAELRGRAEPLGRRLFAERPKAFVRRIGIYWDAWHSPLRASARLELGSSLHA